MFDKGATLNVPTDCSCFDVTQSGMHGISYNVDPAQVTLFTGSGCQASNAVPAADNAQCFDENHELPSSDAHCDSFCGSNPALSSGLFSMKICPGEAAGYPFLPSSTLQRWGFHMPGWGSARPQARPRHLIQSCKQMLLWQAQIAVQYSQHEAIRQ